MKDKILALPITCESASAPFDNKSGLRIAILVAAFVLSFAGYSGILKLLIGSQSLNDELPVGLMIIVAFFAVPLLFYLVILIGSWVIIRALPSDPLYKFSSEKIEIISNSKKEHHTYSNRNITSLTENPNGFQVTSEGQTFHLPKLVNPVGAGIQMIVIPLSRHAGLTFRKLHEIRLVDGQIRIAASWKTRAESSRYTQ